MMNRSQTQRSNRLHTRWQYFARTACLTGLCISFSGSSTGAPVDELKPLQPTINPSAGPRLLRPTTPMRVDGLQTLPPAVNAPSSQAEMRRLLNPAGPVDVNDSDPGAPKVNRFYELAQASPARANLTTGTKRRTPSALVAQRRTNAAGKGRVRANPLVVGEPPALRRFKPDTSGPRKVLGSSRSQADSQPNHRMAIDLIGSHLEPTSAEPISTDRLANDRVSLPASTLRGEIQAYEKELVASSEPRAVIGNGIPQLPAPSLTDQHAVLNSSAHRTADELIAEREDVNQGSDSFPSPYRMNSDRIKPMDVDQLIASETAKLVSGSELEKPEKATLTERLTTWTRRIAGGRPETPAKKESSGSPAKRRRGGILGSLFDQRK